MAKTAFGKFQGKVLLGRNTIEYRVSIQPSPEPSAVVISTDVNPGIVTIALVDWPDLVKMVESLKQEAITQ